MAVLVPHLSRIRTMRDSRPRYCTANITKPGRRSCCARPQGHCQRSGDIPTQPSWTPARDVPTGADVVLLLTERSEHVDLTPRRSVSLSESPTYLTDATPLIPSDGRLRGGGTADGQGTLRAAWTGHLGVSRDQPPTSDRGTPKRARSHPHPHLLAGTGRLQEHGTGQFVDHGHVK